MTESARRQGLPWGTVLTIGALAAVLAGVYRGTAGDLAVPTESLWAVAGTGAATFLVMRWLQNYVWGVLAGVLLALHPLLQKCVKPFERGLVAEALELIVLATTIAAWRLAFLPRFAWRSWSMAAVVLIVGTGLVWPLQPRTALVTAALAGGGLLLGALLAARLHQRSASSPPSWLNIVTAILVGVAAPAAGLFLAPLSVNQLGWHRNPGVPAASDALDLWQAALGADVTAYHIHGFSKQELGEWCRPEMWLMLPLMIWGLYRALRRGWKDWARRKPPLAWVLVLFAVLAVVGESFHPGSGRETDLLSLAAVAVLLAVFGVADLVRGFMERLVLAPPEGQADE